MRRGNQPASPTLICLPGTSRGGIACFIARLHSALALIALPLLASCAAPSTPPSAAPPPPVTRPAPVAPAPTPAPVADRYAGDWLVDELTPGEWRIDSQTAIFSGNRGRTLALIGCRSGRISIIRAGPGYAPRGVLRIRTSAGERELPVEGAELQAFGTSLPAADPLFDQILYSRGRFVIEATGQAPLVLPTEPEVQRVVEDCRG